MKVQQLLPNYGELFELQRAKVGQSLATILYGFELDQLDAAAIWQGNVAQH